MGECLLLAAALFLYLSTLDNGFQPGELIGGDLITHQYAQVQARPSNAPGYPLYTMGGWLWFHGLRGLIRFLGEPLPNPIPLLSSYSTLWGLLALWLLYRIINWLTRSPVWPQGHWPLAWLLSAFYGVTYFFWYYATTTEQYSSAVAQTLAIVYLYLRWQAVADDETARPVAERRLVGLAFLCGLILAHMLTVAFIVPPLVAVILWQRPQLLRAGWLVLRVIGAAALPLLAYLYVYLRGAAHPEWWGVGEWRTAQEWFWAFVSTAQGREELGWGFEPGRAFFGNQFPELIWQELSLPLLVLGLVGMAWLGRKMGVLLYSTLLIYLLFCWAYRYGNWYQVILPAYPLVLLGVAGLLNRLLVASPARGTIGDSHLIQSAIWLGLVGLVIWRVTASWPAANSRNRPGDTALAEAAQLVAQPLPPTAHLFAAVDEALALDYLIHIWQIRPDLRVISSPAAATHLAAGQPVFAAAGAAAILRTELPPTLPLTVQSSAPDWLVLQSQPTAIVPPPTIRETHVVTTDVALVGYTITPAAVSTPVTGLGMPGVDVVLFWQLTADWPGDLSISVRPLRQGAFIPDPAGAAGAILQQDRQRPAHGLLTLGPWPPDQPVADAYRLPLPQPLPGGADAIQVIIYRATADGFANVALMTLPIP